jgi:NitT/TauT family transport system substrate-binding protein
VEEVQPTALPTDTATPEPVQPVKIKVGMFPYSSYAPLYYAQAEGYFTEQGLEVEFVDFTKQPDAVAALAAGQIDVTGGVLDAASLSAIAVGSGVKIVADKGYVDPNAACPYGAWMLRKDLNDSGALSDLANIKGKTVVLTKAGFFEYAMDELLKPVGLSTSDLNLVEMPAPARLEAFGTGAIDIAQVGEPWITRTLAAGTAVVWYPFEVTQPNAQYAVLWYGPTLTKDNPDAGKRFMVAYMKGVQQYNQGKTDRNVALMAEFTKSTPEDAKASCWQAFTSDGHVNLDFVLSFQDWAINKKYVDRAMTVDEFWDGSFLEYAAQQLAQ